MIRLRKRKTVYTFSDKTHPKEGIISVITGTVLLISFLVLFLITSKKQGGLLIGVLGLCIFFGSVAGIWLSVKAMKKEDVLYRFPIIGIVVNGIVLLISVSLYFIGLAANISIH